MSDILLQTMYCGDKDTKLRDEKAAMIVRTNTQYYRDGLFEAYCLSLGRSDGLGSTVISESV